MDVGQQCWLLAVEDEVQHITCRFPRRPLVVAGAVHWPPHVAVTRGPDGLGISGAMGNVMHVLAETLNFT